MGQPTPLLSSLKMECEKLAQEKTEMQRHYVMVSAKESLTNFLPSSSLFPFFLILSREKALRVPHSLAPSPTPSVEWHH